MKTHDYKGTIKTLDDLKREADQLVVFIHEMESEEAAPLGEMIVNLAIAYAEGQRSGIMVAKTDGSKPVPLEECDIPPIPPGALAALS